MKSVTSGQADIGTVKIFTREVQSRPGSRVFMDVQDILNSGGTAADSPE